jgi:hypothetical protein
MHLCGPRFNLALARRYRFGQFATQKAKVVWQSSSASEQTNLHKSKFASAVVKQAASPPAQMAWSSAISRHAFRSALRVTRQDLRQLLRVVGAAVKQVVSRVTQRRAQVTPEPLAKQSGNAVSNAVRQVASSLPRRQQLLYVARAWRMQSRVALLNG